MTSEFEAQLRHVVALCERYNTSATNLLWGNFVPDEVQEEYEELKTLAETDDDVHPGAVRDMIADRTELDSNRIQKRRLHDIDVEIKKGLVFEYYPELEECRDTGLVTADWPTESIKDGFGYKNYFLIYPDTLRHNRALTTALFEKWDGSFDLSLAFDYDQLGLQDTVEPALLFDHWYGPNSIDAVLSSVELESLVQFGTSSFNRGLMDRTEFLFTRRGDEWILQIEELLPRRGSFFEFDTQLHDNQIDFYTRYLHAITDEDLRECIHIDGAIREYPSEDAFVERHTNSSKQLDSDWVKQATNRYKLFKLDADSESIPDYQEIIGLFFKYNPHVIEFFDGPSDRTEDIEDQRTGLFEMDLRDF